MNTLTTTPILVRKAWNNADSNGRKLLEDLYGKEKFQNSDITDIIKTVDDAYEFTKRPRIDLSSFPEDLKDYFQAQYDYLVVVEALNEGWTPNWDDSNERKWQPWVVMSPSAFAFRSSGYGFSFASAGSSSRLYLRSEKLSDYMGRQFADLCKKIQLK